MNIPCHDNRTYTNPPLFEWHPDVIAAVEACHTCPLLQACAEAALTAGDTVDKGKRAPANGVIQAGVLCTGDQDTADQLARIAGVEPPVLTEERYTPPSTCVGCGKHMVTRNKHQPTTPDVLTHAAHGYCRICDAKRRRQKTWTSPTPKHSTIFDWKETHGHRNRRSDHLHGDDRRPGAAHHGGQKTA